MAAAADQLHNLVRDNPDLARKILDANRAEQSLAAYTRQAWGVLEPGQQLVWGWHLDCICDHLEAVSRGEITRLVINVPPGFSKSLMTNVFWPSWEWGPRDEPYLRYLSFAYAQSLTIRDNLRCRRLISSPWFQERWGDRFSLVSDQNAKIRYDTDQSGFRMASSIGGTGTGERGDRLILDDPNNVQDSRSEKITESTLLFVSETLPTRVNDIAKSAIVIIQQRTSVNDVTGHVLRSELGYEWLRLPMHYEADGPCYTPVKRAGKKPRKVRQVKLEEETIPRWIPAGEKPEGLVVSEGPIRSLYPQDRRTKEGQLLDPRRFPKDAVERNLVRPLMSRGGHAAVAGQLDQRPQPREGSQFKRANFRFMEWKEVPAGILWARGWDLAMTESSTSPYTAGVKLGICLQTERVIIADVARDRLEPGPCEDWIKSVVEADGIGTHHDLPQDPAQAGKAQKVSLGKKLRGFKVFFSPERETKPERAVPLQAQTELHLVYLVRGPWNDAFLAEAVTFPGGDYKDQIDAAARALARAQKRVKTGVGEAVPAAPRVIRPA